MTDSEIKSWCNEKQNAPQVIEIPEMMFEELDSRQAEMVISELGGKKMIKLPEREIIFFEHLKQEEPAVWRDLWEDELFEPYLVSINMLPYLIAENENGFPICDLENNPNYFFALEFMQDEESRIVLDAAKNRLLDKQEVSLPHKLALEISQAPIDIWHFAYKYGVSVDKAKQAVQELVDDFALVHLKDADHIAKAKEM